MKKPHIFFLFLLIFLSARTANGEEANYLYKAVIAVPVAGVYERPSATVDLYTQALLNEEIEVIEESGFFVFARVPDGYCGYIRFSDITTDTSSLFASGDRVIVKSKFAAINDLYGNEIYMAPMTSSFFGNLIEDKYLITLPQNRQGYIQKNDILVIPMDGKNPVGSRETFAVIAGAFMNTEYLWGGCSGDGIDCSGLTYIAAKMNGVQIPRDSLPQSQTGVYIDLKNAAVGDQLFFGSDSGKTKVTHTGIYLGEGNFLHSSTDGVVISNIYTSNYYMSRFMFAKRLPFR